jgi:hypothetical protein
VPRARPAAIVLADSPLRERLQRLLAELDALRDEVAQLELECETLRGELAAFEVRHRAELADEQRLLHRIGSVVRQLERWAEMLEEAEPRQRAVRARRVERQRTRELHQESWESELAEEELAPEPSAAADLKSLYRRLARRFHPDLARTEEEQVRHAALMARINALYRAGDRAGLEALADQALGSELPEPAVSLEEEVRLLEERRAWFESARDGLRLDLQSLSGCATAELFRRWRQAGEDGRDFFDELRAELASRCEVALGDVRDAAGALEDAVRRANRRSLATEGRRSLDRAFDPLGRQRLVRLSLEALEVARAAPEARAEAERIAELARTSPAAARLVLFAYASELVPHPWMGCGGTRTSRSGSSISARATRSRGRWSALVEARTWSSSGSVAPVSGWCRAGCGSGRAAARRGAARAPEACVRVEFRRVLATLGERTGCPECREEIRHPLYRLRGLDDLHASACPRCATWSGYFLPRGKDVQSVLNTAFLDLELLSEWSFRMGAASVSVSCFGAGRADDGGQLKRRFWADVLERHGIPVPADAVRLQQGRRPVQERRKLADLERQEFVVAFGEKAGVSVADALETVKHRIRTRFRPDAAAAGR